MIIKFRWSKRDLITAKLWLRLKYIFSAKSWQTFHCLHFWFWPDGTTMASLSEPRLIDRSASLHMTIWLFSEFQLWPKIPLKLAIFSIMKKLWYLKKVLGNLEAEGQGRGIIMGVTRLLLLGPFYYIALYWGV